MCCSHGRLWMHMFVRHAHVRITLCVAVMRPKQFVSKLWRYTLCEMMLRMRIPSFPERLLLFGSFY